MFKCIFKCSRHTVLTSKASSPQGLDPASRKNLWRVVQSAKAEKAIILTTHSMQEAAVLCDRLGIFVGGRMVILGNPKQLISKHGGYKVGFLSTLL